MISTIVVWFSLRLTRSHSHFTGVTALTYA